MNNLLPPGFREVKVLVNDLEYEKLMRARALQPRGTVSEVIRTTMGWPYLPRGLPRAEKQFCGACRACLDKVPAGGGLGDLGFSIPLHDKSWL